MTPPSTPRWTHRTALVLGLTLLLGACGSGEEPAPPVSGGPAPDTAAAPAPGPDAAPLAHPARSDELVQAARDVVSFLRGDVPFSEVRTAEIVTLRLSPEGGGAQISLPREQLADPRHWEVPTTSGGRQSLVPPSALTQLTLKPGVHFNCLEYALASVAPDLAMLPHVGVSLAPSGSTSCLQTWNMTLVFDTAGEAPGLRAVVYDQWEW